MALQDTTSQPHVATLLAHINGEVRQVAFRTGNPNLAAEVAALAENPRRIRKLNADAAMEAISWIEDPAVIEAIVEVDPRVAVLESARSRMRELEHSLSTSSNERNVRERTARALAKDPLQAITALEGMTAIDTNAVVTWMGNLDDKALAKALVMALGHVALSSERALYDLASRAMQNLSPADAAELAEKLCVHVGAAERVLALWSGPYTATLAPVIAATNRYAPDDINIIDADEGCRRVWEEMERLDLLLWADAIPVEEADALFDRLQALDPYDLHRPVLFMRNPAVIDAIVKKADAAGWFKQEHRTGWRGTYDILTVLLRIPGISDETAKRLVSFACDENVMSYLVGPRATDEVLALAASTHEAYELVQGMRRRDDDSPAAIEKFLDALFEHSPSLPNYLTTHRGRWYRTEAVDKGIAERAAAALGTSEQAWQMFWMLHGTAEAVTYRDLVNAALALKD